LACFKPVKKSARAHSQQELQNPLMERLSRSRLQASQHPFFDHFSSKKLTKKDLRLFSPSDGQTNTDSPRELSDLTGLPPDTLPSRVEAFLAAIPRKPLSSVVLDNFWLPDPAFKLEKDGALPLPFDWVRSAFRPTPSFTSMGDGRRPKIHPFRRFYRDWSSMPFNEIYLRFALIKLQNSRGPNERSGCPISALPRWVFLTLGPRRFLGVVS